MASEQFKTTNSDAFGLLQGPDGLASLQPQSTTRALKHVIRDADLTWEQFSLAVPTYLREIERADWPKTHVEMMSAFFYALQHHPSHSRPHSSEALLRYQAKTRYDWHELISRGSPSYSLALINNNLLDQMCSEIADEIFLAQQKQLFPSKPILCIPHATFPPLHLTCTFTASHTHPHRVSHAFSLPPPPLRPDGVSRPADDLNVAIQCARIPAAMPTPSARSHSPHLQYDTTHTAVLTADGCPNWRRYPQSW